MYISNTLHVKPGDPCLPIKAGTWLRWRSLPRLPAPTLKRPLDNNFLWILSYALPWNPRDQYKSIFVTLKILELYGLTNSANACTGSIWLFLYPSRLQPSINILYSLLLVKLTIVSFCLIFYFYGIKCWVSKFFILFSKKSNRNPYSIPSKLRHAGLPCPILGNWHLPTYSKTTPPITTI